MSAEIVSTRDFAKSLEAKYRGLEIPVYKLKAWFSTSQKVFFDCETSDKSACLHEALAKPDFPAFRIYLIIKDSVTSNYGFMDVNFRNLGGKETLEHFINRYHQQLEAMTKLSLQGATREYVECIGHSYEETMP